MQDKPFKPTLYMPMFVQQPEAIQSALFAIARDVEPRAEEPCAHPDSQVQWTLDNEPVLTCTSCGRELGAALPCETCGGSPCLEACKSR